MNLPDIQAEALKPPFVERARLGGILLKSLDWLHLPACAVLLATGCQGNIDGTSSGTDTSGGGTSTVTSTTGPGAAGGSAGGAAGATGGSGGAPVTSGSTAGGELPVTIEAVHAGRVPPDSPIAMEGVVAMSRKFLVSHSNVSGSCLFGAYISSAGLAETTEGSGILMMSYGESTMGDEPCPQGTDGIPEDLSPGDQIDLLGEVRSFLPSSCSSMQGDTTVPEWQIGNVHSIIKVDVVPVPAAHTLSAAEIASLASPGDVAFHDKWGGVKVKIIDAAMVGIGPYGLIQVTGGGAPLSVGIGLSPVPPGLPAICSTGPVYSDPAMTFTSIEGFSRIEACMWMMRAVSKCDDLLPPSEDCAGQSCL